jgi:hypothetical protein
MTASEINTATTLLVAIEKIYGSSSLRKQFTLNEIRSTLATYFYCSAAAIDEEVLTEVLRECKFATPHPGPKGKLYWRFTSTGPKQPSKTKKQRQYRDVPLAESQKLKRV